MDAAAVSALNLVARRINVRGVVQGVGFRPFVFRLARAHALTGWVLNDGDGVHIHVEGDAGVVDAFVEELRAHAPPASNVSTIDVQPVDVTPSTAFEIRDSESAQPPVTRMSADIDVCDRCLEEMRSPSDRRFRYPYINCTDCGPRYSIIRALPYDRARTTMGAWTLCAACAAEYESPLDRRFHAQLVACPICGPRYQLRIGDSVADDEPVAAAARLLTHGAIVAVKGIGGYHLACDADNVFAVGELRERKYRKEQAFAVMVRDVDVADQTVALSAAARELLLSPARPIVLAPALKTLPGVAPDCRELGVMLPYTPLHHLLFAAGAPARLVTTSGNRSSEPIAYIDDDASRRLDGLCDAILIGERPIARRVDDSVVRPGQHGPTVLRRSRGMAPGVVATLPAVAPILALGGDLKNAITLVVNGNAYVSQHIGDLSHRESAEAFEETIRDLTAMYDVDPASLRIVHDLHPRYASTAYAARFEHVIGIQHHRAHIASVLAERGELDRAVIGVAFDGTGYGDDGTIWGGEMFTGSVRGGFERVTHLRPALLPGGDAAARYPVQAAAGFLYGVDGLPDLTAAPFGFPKRFEDARAVIRSGLRTFTTTSAGRLFDVVAALCGFTRAMTYEGQAAMWLEQLAMNAQPDAWSLPCAFHDGEIDWRELLAAIIDARLRGAQTPIVARAFHRSLARATASAIAAIAASPGIGVAVCSGGTFQNALLVADLRAELQSRGIELWLNHQVPPGDGGLSLGQAALAACAPISA